MHAHLHLGLKGREGKKQNKLVAHGLIFLTPSLSLINNTDSENCCKLPIDASSALSVVLPHND